MGIMDLITGNPLVFWAIVCGVFLLIEALTMGLTTIWFSAGALLALVISFFHVNFGIQFAVFLVSSLVFLALTRKIFVQKLGTGSVKTNVDALVGERTIVTSDIKAYEPGTVKIKGQEWSAVCEDRSGELASGTEVEVIGIEGVKAIVKPLD